MEDNENQINLNTSKPIFCEADLNTAERRRFLTTQRKDWFSQVESSPFYFCRPLIMNITIEEFCLSLLIRSQAKRKNKPSNKRSSKGSKKTKSPVENPQMMEKQG